MTLRYRSRAEIISQILEAANGHVDITKTKLMYKAFLSQSQVKGYAKVLIEIELLRYDSVTRTFKTTQKGLKFLHLYNKINEVLMEKEEQQEGAEREIGLHNMRQTGYYHSLKL